jgi:hypothetical protein
MKTFALNPLQWSALTIALLRGLGEFAALQRWRLRAWLRRALR